MKTKCTEQFGYLKLNFQRNAEMSSLAFFCKKKIPKNKQNICAHVKICMLTHSEQKKKKKCHAALGKPVILLVCTGGGDKTLVVPAARWKVRGSQELLDFIPRGTRLKNHSSSLIYPTAVSSFYSKPKNVNVGHLLSRYRLRPLSRKRRCFFGTYWTLDQRGLTFGTKWPGSELV